jgi:hypothetical protein
MRATRIHRPCYAAAEYIDSIPCDPSEARQTQAAQLRCENCHAGKTAGASYCDPSCKAGFFEQNSFPKCKKELRRLLRIHYSLITVMLLSYR